MRILLGIGLGAMLAVALLEVALRFMPVHSGARMEATSADRPFSRYLPRQEYIYSHGWAFTNARHGVTNGEGFPNSPDSGGERGVLIVGDSFIEGLMLDYRDTVQGYLDQHFGVKVQAVAASGNGLADSLRIIDYFAPKIDPACVVVFVDQSNFTELLSEPSRGHSGFVWSDGKVSVVHNEYRESPTKQVVQRSALARYIYYNLNFPQWLRQLRLGSSGRKNEAAAADRSAVEEEVLEYYLSEVRSIALAESFRVIFLLDGDREGIYVRKSGKEKAEMLGDRNRFLRLAAIQGQEVVDMQPVFERHWELHRERMDFFPMDGHWNPVAHRLAAEELMRVGLAKCAPAGTDLER